MKAIGKQNVKKRAVFELLFVMMIILPLIWLKPFNISILGRALMTLVFSVYVYLTVGYSACYIEINDKCINIVNLLFSTQKKSISFTSIKSIKFGSAIRSGYYIEINVRDTNEQYSSLIGLSREEIIKLTEFLHSKKVKIKSD